MGKGIRMTGFDPLQEERDWILKRRGVFVLSIQGGHDSLVGPAGLYKMYHMLHSIEMEL